MNLKDLKRTEEKEVCYKCGVLDFLYEDPNIEDLFFCEKCWQERIKTEEIEKWGFEEEIPYE